MKENEQDNYKQLEFINGMAFKNIYAHAQNITELSIQGNRSRRFSRDQIRKAMSSPYSNIETLQAASSTFKVASGIYARLLNYQSCMLTNYYTMFPYDISKIKTDKKFKKAHLETAMFLQKYNIIRNSPWIYSRVLEQGELFAYEIEDNLGIILMEIPSRLCKVTGVVNDVNRFSISLKKLNASIVKGLPKEIQDAYVLFKSGNMNKDNLIDGEWFEVGDNGVAFNLNKYQPKCVPFYSSLFDDLMELEDMKDLRSSTAIIENLKIIHQQLPTDKSTGDVQMDFEVAQAYHNDTAGKVPKGTTVVTNPMPLKAVTLTDGSSKAISNVKDSINSIYDHAGVSIEMFNADRASNEAIANGVITDSLVALEIQKSIAAWINYKLLTKNKKNGIWQMRFIEGMTHYNKDTYVTRARESMSFSGDKSTFFACCGLTPLEAMNTLTMEKMIGLDELMTPVSSSHTSSSSGGRPSKTEDGGSDGNSNQPVEE